MAGGGTVSPASTVAGAASATVLTSAGDSSAGDCNGGELPSRSSIYRAGACPLGKARPLALLNPMNMACRSRRRCLSCAESFAIARHYATILPIPKLVKREKLASVQKVRIMIIGAESAIIAPGKNSVIFCCWRSAILERGAASRLSRVKSALESR